MGKKTAARARGRRGPMRDGTEAETGELKAHPYAEQFQLMEGAEYERFRRDIERSVACSRADCRPKGASSWEG